LTKTPPSPELPTKTSTVSLANGTL
jgi:hypothetical protein